MRQKMAKTIAEHPRIVTLAVLTVLLLVGGVGEAAAHNPAGVKVPACELGADAVAANNPNCH